MRLLLLNVMLPERSQHGPAAIAHILRSRRAQQQRTLGARRRARRGAVQVAAAFRKSMSRGKENMTTKQNKKKTGRDMSLSYVSRG